MDSVTRFLSPVFFHESSSSKPLKLKLGSFRICSKICADTYPQVKVQQVSTTPVVHLELRMSQRIFGSRERVGWEVDNW
jgi:hypothetical protein